MISISNIIYIVSGVWLSLQYAVIALVIGCCFGIIISSTRLVFNNKYLNIFISAYISILRGTPILVQLMLVYFALPSITGIDISGYLAGIIAFSLNSSAYISEILRAGLQSIPQNQFDACRTLGIPNFLMMKDIILPQAFKNSLPAIINESIALLKETAIISVIGEADIMRRATIVSIENYSYMEPLLTAAVCYYTLVLLLTKLGDKFERGFSYA